MSIKFKFFILYDIFLINLLIAMIIIIKPIYSSDTTSLDGITQSTTISSINQSSREKIGIPPIKPISIQQHYSDIEEFREINRFNEMYNDFPRISYDTIHQILRDEDSGNGDSIYRRDEKRYQRRWEISTTSTVIPIDSNDKSHKKISHTRVKRNSITNNLDLTSQLIENDSSNSTLINNNNNNNSDKYINNSRINSTKILNLTNCNLTTIFNLDILTNHSTNNIQILNLTNNKLLTFHLNNLINLKQLQILDLTHNNLSEFILNGNQLESLKVLNLTGNRVKQFSIINQLPINNNNTKPIIFKLKELSLQNNCIKSINSLNLTMLNDLEILDLSCNQIYKLNQNFMEKVKNIKYLNLSKNRLGDGVVNSNTLQTYVQNNTKINHTIDNKTKRFLSSNKNYNNDTITTKNSDAEPTIFKEPFYNLLNIDTLILSYNNIQFIDFETFMVLPNLQYLDLSHNMIQGESIKSLQGIPDLVGLSIAYNPDLGDSLQEFVASWSLKELDASGTGLCRIPAALAQSVRTLKLVDNWLSIISCGDLDSYPLLQYLDLSHSHIDDIEEDALGRLEMLETLFLDHNNLKRIPISLPTSLENLFLHQNQITDIQPQIFQGLHNLKTLDLSHNKLLYLPGLPLPKLLTLNLQSSELKRLSQSVVKTSPKLRDLLLDDNPIKCSDLLGIAEWTSICYGENYENNQHSTSPKDIKKLVQQKFQHFAHFKESENTLNQNHECCSNSAIMTNHSVINQIIPKCAANLKNKQLIVNETLQLQTNNETTTTTNSEYKLDNFKDKILNLSTNNRSWNWPTAIKNIGQQEQEHKKITPNEVDIIKLNFTTTTIFPVYSTTHNFPVDDYSTVNTQEKNPILVKGYKDILSFPTTTTTIQNKFPQKEENSLNKINEKNNIISVIPTIKSFSSISGNIAELSTNSNPTIEVVFKRDKQMNINKEKTLQEIQMNAKILPILSLSLNNSSETIQQNISNKMSNDTRKNLIKNNTENILKHVQQSVQDNTEENKFLMKSDNNYFGGTTSVLLDQMDNVQQQQQQQQHNYNNDENFEKTIKTITKINNNSMTLGQIQKNIIDNLPNIYFLNKTDIININNNKTTENILKENYLQETTTKNFHKIENNFEKNNDRRLYASSKLLKDKQQYSYPLSLTENPLNNSLLTTQSSDEISLKNNIKNSMMAPLPLNSKDKENENSKKILQQQKIILDEINRSEIKRRKIYKNSQMRRDEKTNIKNSIIELTTSATTFINWSIVESENQSTLPKITESTITTTTLASIKSKNKLQSTKVNKADKVIFSNNGQNNVNTMTYSGDSANENVIIKGNQKNLSTIFMNQQQPYQSTQQKFYDKNLLKLFPTTSKSKFPPQLHQISPIFLDRNLLYQEKQPIENLILNKRPSTQNHSIVNDMNLNTQKISLISSTGEPIQLNNQLKRNLENSNLNTSENIVFHKSINLDKYQKFGINENVTLIGNNNNNNNRKFSQIKIETDHNEGNDSNRNENLSTNIKGSSKIIEIFSELNKRDNINSDINNGMTKNSNKNLDNIIKLTEIENLMSDQKDEFTNDNFNDLLKSSQSNTYHHYSNDDNDSKNFKENFKKSFNEFKKDTTEFIKLEHQHSGNFTRSTQPSQSSSLMASNQENDRQFKSKIIDIPSVNNEFSTYTNINDDNSTVSSSSYNDNDQFENHLKVNTEIVHQLKQQQNLNNPLKVELQIPDNHNKLNITINSISSNNNNNSKIISALENIQLQQSKDNNVSKINISKNNIHKNVRNGGNDIDNSEIGNGLSPEQWLEIRLNNQTTTGHPGLFIVIGITFSLIFILGIIHIYRCHRKPWYYTHHSRQNNHHHNFNDRNYGNHDYRNRCCRRRQQCQLNSTRHSKCTCNEMIIMGNSEQNENNTTNHDEVYCCECNNDDDINDYYIEMSDQNLRKTSSVSSISPQRKNIFQMELLRLPEKPSTISTLSRQIDNENYTNRPTDLRTSHFGGNLYDDDKNRPIIGRKQW